MSFYIYTKEVPCVQGDIATVTVGKYTEQVIITHKHNGGHKKKIATQIKNIANIEELTPEQICLQDSTKEWKNDVCVNKEAPKCYKEVCEQIPTTCNIWNYERECNWIQTTCKIWNYEEQCVEVTKDVWYKNGPGKKELCTAHDHKNCHKETITTEECTDVKTTCKFWNYRFDCENVQTTCNIWNYEEHCSQIETDCKA